MDGWDSTKIMILKYKKVQNMHVFIIMMKILLLINAQFELFCNDPP